MRFVLAPILLVIGVLLMKYTVQVTNFTGQIDFAEEYLKSPLAGTYTWWRAVGFVVCLVSIAWLFGYINFGSLLGQ